MKLFASLLSSAALSAILSVVSAAAAQTPTKPTKPAAPTTTTTTTTDYTEQTNGGDQVVTFGRGDELAAPRGGAYGDTIRRPPGVTRVGLIRPRLNFISELLKSVENL